MNQDSHQLWHATERHKERLQDWIEAAAGAHDHFAFTPNERVNNATLAKPLTEARVALLTTAGVHLREQNPFDTKSAVGDPSYREIPSDAGHHSLTVTDTHFNTEGAEGDINCLFPIEILARLEVSDEIGSLAARHFGFMGFNPNPIPQLTDSAEEVAEKLLADDVDIAVLSPG